MKLTVLGKWSPYPPAGGACPGYLVETGGVRILLDCGPGVAAMLRRFCSVFELDALVITHLHPDHFTDIYSIALERRFGTFPGPSGPPLTLFAPDDAGDYLPACLPDERSRREFANVFALHPLEEGSGEVTGIRLRFARTFHPQPCHGVEVAADGKRLVYSADTGPSDAVEHLAAGADLFLCESTLAEGSPEDLIQEVGHLTGGLAGAMARRAGVRRLLLTHFFTPHHAVKESHAAAAKEFGDRVQVAEEGVTYEV